VTITNIHPAPARPSQTPRLVPRLAACDAAAAACCTRC